MRMTIGNHGILAAALAVASMPLGGGSVPDLHMPAPAIGYEPPRPHKQMRLRTAGKHRPAGAKLWRKAKEGKLGVRW